MKPDNLEQKIGFIHGINHYTIFDFNIKIEDRYSFNDIFRSFLLITFFCQMLEIRKMNVYLAT